MLHYGEGPVPLLEEVLQLGLPPWCDLDFPHAPETRTGEVRQEAILLEEHPAQDLSSLQLLFGEVGRTLREIVQDRAGLREHRPVFEFQNRYLAVRVDVLQELRGVCLAALGIVVDYLAASAQKTQEQPNLVAVPRPRGGV